MERRVVYDSDTVQPGRCPACAKRMDRCTCGQTQLSRHARAEPKALKVPRDGVVRLLRDRKSRGGKTVTLITGLSGTTEALTTLTSELKRLCGAGGTLRGDVVEIQGDFRDRLQTELERRGYTVKIAGG
jgi:translation initiation factor 1